MTKDDEMNPQPPSQPAVAPPAGAAPAASGPQVPRSDGLESVLAALDLQGRVSRHPYGLVGAALGVGYLLGGGLFTPTTARLVRVTVKLAAVPLFRDELLALAESAIDEVLKQGSKFTTAPAADAHKEPPC